MTGIKVYNMKGSVVGEIELNDNVFGVEYNESLIHQAVVTRLANERQGTKSTLTRSEVRGGGVKPWRQKGTGRARSGSTRSPIWVGGGTVFGPQPRSYAFSMPKKQRRLAIKCALSSKVNDQEIFVVDSINFDQPKTKNVVKMLGDFKAEGKALIITADAIENVERSASNIPGVKVITSMGLNVYDLLHYTKIFVAQDAISRIEEVLA